MNVVDSSGWLEFFADGPNAPFFAAAIEDLTGLIVPTISIYEVYKRVLQQRGQRDAMDAVAAMQQGHVVDLDVGIAVSAATISLAEQLPLADSVILASARAHAATLWTQDADFEKVAGVRFVERPPGPRS